MKRRGAFCAITMRDLKALLRKKKVRGLRKLKVRGECAVLASDLEKHLKRRKKKR